MFDTRHAPTPRDVEIPASSPGAPARTWTDPIAITSAVVAAVAWAVFVGVSFAVQPPPADPTAPPSEFAALVSLLFSSALFASLVGLGARRRWGLATTLGGGVVMIGAAVSCYLGGHTGSWIAIQLAAGVGLAVTGAALLRFD